MRKLLFIIILVCSTLLPGCSGDDQNGGSTRIKDLGQQAAVEFCDCFKENSKDYCLDQLMAKYSQSDYLDADFINAFNDQSSCGVTLQKITVPQ